MNRVPRFAIVLTIIACAAPLAVAEYLPPNGGEDILSLVSPTFVAGGTSVVSLETPQANALNPAAAGLTQRVTVDLSYLGLPGIGATGTQAGYRGHAVNLGLTIPTRAGVFASSGHFVTSPYDSLAVGTLGGLRASFSKDLYTNLLIGAGVSALFGGNGGSAGWGLGADLGFIHLHGDMGMLQDFRWGVAFRGLGKGYRPAAGRTGYPAPFTLGGAAGFTLVDSEVLDLSFTSDLSFPSFQNVRFGLGSTLSFRDFIALRTSWGIDLQELINPQLEQGSLIPTVGLSVTFKTDIRDDVSFLNLTERGWNRSEVKTQMAAAPISDDLWAIGLGANIPLGVIDTNPPDVRIEYPEIQYVSPNHDGVQDDLTFPVTITDQRYVQGYTFKVLNDSGSVVREIRNKDERPENEGFQNIVDRLLAVDSGITIPDAFRWDGVTDAGTTAPDGRYAFVVEAWDDNGNVARSDAQDVVIDATPPSVAVQEPEQSELIFSPNNDGNKDTLTIVQEGTTENLWKAEISDAADQIVRTVTWDNTSPEEFVWDGQNDNDILVPDGVYSYTITSTDHAGNSTVAHLDNILVNTQATPIALTIDSSYFSPNNDGVHDAVTFRLRIPVTTGIESWNLQVLDETGTDVRTFSGESRIPERIAFDGQSDTGRVLNEGRYQGSLHVRYVSGNEPSTQSPQFTVDLTPPQATVKADHEVFSPNGDGNKDMVTLFQETSEEDTWSGKIFDQNGNEVDSYSWIERPDPKITWDGHGNDGRLLADGLYVYRLESVDRAGNRGMSDPVTFRLNTEETPVFLSAEFGQFSPNADGQKDQQRLFPQVKTAEGIQSYEITIMDARGNAVRTFTGRGGLRSEYAWDGLTDAGRRVPDGTYSAEVSILYANGNEPSAKSSPFVVDTEYPTIAVEADRRLFSPNNDGKKDTVTFTHDSSSEDLWEGRLLSNRGTVVRTVFWKGEASRFTWDGTDEAGNRAPDGTYRYVIATTDKAGNTAEAEVRSIILDTKPTPIFATASTTGFSPNGDDEFETVTIGMIVNVEEGIESWSLALAHEDGSTPKVFRGDREIPPRRITWDGRPERGRPKEGTYRGVLTVVYSKGNEPTAETTEFTLDTSPPETEISLTPTPFSPDNDGVDDELQIGLDVEDRSGIERWELQILDPRGKPFTQFAGRGSPSDQIIWDGRARDGELVQAAEDYPFEFTVTDRLANTTSVTGEIPVDVLVIRDGDKLKIRISSITFAPNSPALMTDDEEASDRNIQVLGRLAEILNKYRRYNIRIEGHAVSVYWEDEKRAEREEREELKPLSLARAQTVKDALTDLGVDGSRISVAGLGGTDPVVPHGDLENRWKNRRVEFILIR